MDQHQHSLFIFVHPPRSCWLAVLPLVPVIVSCHFVLEFKLYTDRYRLLIACSLKLRASYSS